MITDNAVGRWVASACAAYLEQCTVLEAVRAASGLSLLDRGGPHPPGAALGSASAVVVTAGNRRRAT